MLYATNLLLLFIILSVCPLESDNKPWQTSTFSSIFKSTSSSLYEYEPPGDVIDIIPILPIFIEFDIIIGLLPTFDTDNGSIRFATRSRIANLQSSRGFYEANIVKNYNNTLQHYLSNNKVAILYTQPKFFTDLKFLPNQESSWEFIVLYTGQYGLRVLANCGNSIYLLYSWNNELNTPIQYKAL